MSISIQIAYLIASILFVVGIKMLNRTKTARKGNIVSAIGMFTAILATVVQVDAISYTDILICIVVGSGIGLIIAYKVKMTKVPEMVALFNGFGGLASLAVVLSDFWLNTQQRHLDVDSITGTSVVLSIFIGGITFTGSLIAFLKLNGRISGQPITFSGQHFINLVFLIAAIVIAVLALTNEIGRAH